MAYPDKAKWIAWLWIAPPAVSVVLRYALALVSVVLALGLARIFLYFHLPQPFTAFALCAIAITFWCGGIRPGILAALLSALVRTFYFEPEVDAASRIVYDLVFLIFAVLMTQATRARDELEERVAERTAALRQTEAYLAEAQRLSHTGSWVWRVAGKDSLHLSDEWYRLFGFDREEGVPTWEERLQRIHPEDRAKWQSAIERAIGEKSEYEVEFRILLPTGTVKYVHAVGHPVLNESGDLVQFVGSATDITERKRAEDDLRRSEAYLAEAQRLTHTGSWACNITTREILYSSEEHSRLYGFDPEMGVPSFEDIYQRIHPEDREWVLASFERANRTGTDVEVRFRVVLPDGSTRYMHAVSHPVFKPSGDVGEFVGILMDVTERKRADEEREKLREAQADLAHISRVTTMGELTASLAHEVNQPIAAAVTDASTCLRWLTRDHPDVEEAREAASRVMKDATRAAEIISRIRLLFKKGIPERTLVDVNEVIREMIVLFRSEVTRHSISVRTELATDILPVMGDRVQLQQVMMNLILNSVDAMKDVDGTRELAIKSQRGKNEHLLVSVSDTGVGLPQQADRIFNAFFTTKLHGTGMGLRISRSIVESHGGCLWAADNFPRGASLYLTLPMKTETHE